MVSHSGKVFSIDQLRLLPIALKTDGNFHLLINLQISLCILSTMILVDHDPLPAERIMPRERAYQVLFTLCFWDISHTLKNC
jgi:hypothetical protein